MLMQSRRSPRVIAQSAVAVPHTGTTAFTNIVSITIPAGSIGANGSVEVEVLWSSTSSANNKSLRILFGGTTLMNNTVTTTPQCYSRLILFNRNSQSSQVAPPTAIVGPSNSGTALVTAAVNTAADVTLTLSGVLASAAETITVEAYKVIVSPKA